MSGGPEAAPAIFPSGIHLIQTAVSDTVNLHPRKAAAASIGPAPPLMDPQHVFSLKRCAGRRLGRKYPCLLLPGLRRWRISRTRVRGDQVLIQRSRGILSGKCSGDEEMSRAAPRRSPPPCLGDIEGKVVAMDEEERSARIMGCFPLHLHIWS